MLTEKLIQTFVHCDEKADPGQARTAYGKFAGAVGIVCNAALCAGKAVVGAASGSVAIVADALNNLSDASSSVISLLGFKMASKPADEGHPYGHGRFEYLCAMAVAVLIVVVGAGLIQNSAEKIFNPEPISMNAVNVAILVTSIGVKLWMMAFNSTLARRISSKVLDATAQDSRNDAITTTAVLAACLISEFTGVNLDGWAGAAVGVFIVISGAGLVRDTVDLLLGQAPDPELIERISKRVLTTPGVLGAHDLNIYDYGPGRLYGSVHVEMDGRRSLSEAHAVIDRLERKIRQDEGLDLTIHADPVAGAGTSQADLHAWLEARVRGVDARLKVDDESLVRDKEGREVLFFTVVCPAQEGLDASALTEQICAAISQDHPDYACRLTWDNTPVARLA